ncbi:Elongation factor G 1 [Frankliniella fusca]|uniref:Elongation factor G 1 n=1 Tax=Frankliniella fusca TaxID=407009 RepID=A0AAE1H9Z1_9NEOP|nr:Elongation factor G 1 [Frankliniella fusca]
MREPLLEFQLLLTMDTEDSIYPLPFCIIKMSDVENNDVFYEIALSNWISGILDDDLAGKIHWPPSNKVAQLVRTQSPVNKDWEVHDMIVKRFYDTWAHARASLPKITEDSNYETEKEQDLGRGKRRKRVRQLDSDSDDCTYTSKSKTANIPPPPKVTVNSRTRVVNRNAVKKAQNRAALMQELSEARKKTAEKTKNSSCSVNWPAPRLTEKTSPWRVSKLRDLPTTPNAKESPQQPCYSKEALDTVRFLFSGRREADIASPPLQSLGHVSRNLFEDNDGASDEFLSDVPEGFTEATEENLRYENQTDTVIDSQQNTSISPLVPRSPVNVLAKESILEKTPEKNGNNGQSKSPCNELSNWYCVSSGRNPVEHRGKSSGGALQSLHRSNSKHASSVLDFEDRISALEKLAKDTNVKVLSLSSKCDMILMNTGRLLRSVLPHEKRIQAPPDMPGLPLQSKQDLLLYEEFLQKASINMSAVVDYMSIYVKSNVPDPEKKSLHSVLSELFTDELAQNFNLDGKNHKIPLRKLSVFKVIKATLSSAFQSSDLSDLDSNAAKWCADAKWRLSRRQEKSLCISKKKY